MGSHNAGMLSTELLYLHALPTWSSSQINLKGVWWGCKYAILAMRNNTADEAKGLHAGGSIINTASFVAIMGAATPQLAYTASKVRSPQLCQ